MRLSLTLHGPAFRRRLPRGNAAATRRPSGSLFYEMELSSKRLSQDMDRLESRVRVALLDPTDLALLHSGFLGKRSLRQPQRTPTLRNFPRESEVGLEGLRLGDCLRPLTARLGLQVAHEVTEPAAHWLYLLALNMGFSPSAVKVTLAAPVGPMTTAPIGEPFPSKLNFSTLAPGAGISRLVVASEQENELFTVSVAEDPKEDPVWVARRRTLALPLRAPARLNHCAQVPSKPELEESTPELLAKLGPAHTNTEVLEDFVHGVPDRPALARSELLLQPPSDGLVACFVLVELNMEQ
jgi:hypothetical protein